MPLPKLQLNPYYATGIGYFDTPDVTRMHAEGTHAEGTQKLTEHKTLWEVKPLMGSKKPSPMLHSFYYSKGYRVKSID